MTFKLRVTISLILSAAILMLASSLFVSAEEKLLGDANGDGNVNIDDVTCIQRQLAGFSLNGDFFESAADIDGNSIIAINDATEIQVWLADFETQYQIGKQQPEPTTQMPTDDQGWGRYIFQP